MCWLLTPLSQQLQTFSVQTNYFWHPIWRKSVVWGTLNNSLPIYWLTKYLHNPQTWSYPLELKSLNSMGVMPWSELSTFLDQVQDQLTSTHLRSIASARSSSPHSATGQHLTIESTTILSDSQYWHSRKWSKACHEVSWVLCPEWSVIYARFVSAQSMIVQTHGYSYSTDLVYETPMSLLSK